LRERAYQAIGARLGAPPYSPAARR
jgi:hypothetical protein